MTVFSKSAVYSKGNCRAMMVGDLEEAAVFAWSWGGFTDARVVDDNCIVAGGLDHIIYRGDTVLAESSGAWILHLSPWDTRHVAKRGIRALNSLGHSRLGAESVVIPSLLRLLIFGETVRALGRRSK